jgi:hypothetical protein
LSHIKHDTIGRRRLEQLKRGPSELCAELKAATGGMKLDVSTVSRWRSGDIRPEAFWRIVMRRTWKIPESAWLLPEEQVALSGKGAA